VDLSRYGQACSELLNMTIIPHGAVTRRMGTEYVATASGDHVRLIPFVFNTGQAYVLELTPGGLRFFRNGGYLQGKDLDAPWTADDLADLSYCQSADVMYLVCRRHAPQKLVRDGADSFILSEVSFTAAPEEWGQDNWPRVITFHQQRLWLGGTANQAQKLWASKTGDFENFTTGTDDDSALALSLVSEQVNAVHWLLSQKTLIVGTAGGEWVIASSGSDALTAKNIQATRNSNYGTSPVRPLVAGSSAMHVSADKRRLRDISYAFADDAYISQDISLLAEHITRPGIEEMAHCQNPDGIIWCRLSNGDFAGITYLRAQEVAGWHRHATAGEVLSIICVPAQSHTETWLAVRRRNGVHIERMKAPWDGATADDPGCWFVDCGLLYEGEAVSSVSGLEHLEGESVAVLADGAAHRQCVVRQGAVRLDWPARRVVVGLPYAWSVAPMRMEGLSPRGTMQGKKTRILKLMARLYKSLGVLWSVPGQSDAPYPLAARDVDMMMDEAPLPFTGDAEMPMPGGWSSDARVRLSGDGAFPATIIMLSPTAAVNE
jgi:hypothetical protein